MLLKFDCVNNLSKVALDSAAARIEPAISSCKSSGYRALDLRLEIAGSIPAAALSSATLDKLFTHIVQRQQRPYGAI